MTVRKIDHIVYCVPNLEEAIIHFKNKLGVNATIGGKHSLKGTKNALIHLGEQCYLELLAIDDHNHGVSPPRWMGIDLVKKPQITRWAIQSDHLIDDQKIVQTYNPLMGIIEEGQRRTPDNILLKWQMTLPLAEPEVELIPFLLNWENSAHHPTDKMEVKCSLQFIKFYGKENLENTKRCFQDLSIDYKIHYSKETKITATIEGPKGIVQI